MIPFFPPCADVDVCDVGSVVSGTCTHLCLRSGNLSEPTCACPDNFQLQGMSCVGESLAALDWDDRGIFISMLAYLSDFI